MASAVGSPPVGLRFSGRRCALAKGGETVARKRNWPGQLASLLAGWECPLSLPGRNPQQAGLIRCARHNPSKEMFEESLIAAQLAEAAPPFWGYLLLCA